MPTTVSIDGLFVDDTQHVEDYTGLYIFTDPDDLHDGVDDIKPAAKRPFPYAPCHKVEVRNLKTASGKKARLSPNKALEKSIALSGLD